MLSFMFAVLGSVTFWAIYGVISLFIGTFFLKRNHENTFEEIVNGWTSVDDFDDFIIFFGDVLCPFIWVYIFWPIIILWYIIAFIFSLIFKTIIANIIRKAIIFADKATPEISFNIKKKE
jgi:hypothetical protein